LSYFIETRTLEVKIHRSIVMFGKFLNMQSKIFVYYIENGNNEKQVVC